MNEPIKKRLIGAVVIAVVGGLALSFVLHDSHPTYSEASHTPYSEPANLTAAHSDTPKRSPETTRLLILPEKTELAMTSHLPPTTAQTLKPRSSHPSQLQIPLLLQAPAHSPLPQGRAHTAQGGTCHYGEKTHNSSCDDGGGSHQASMKHSDLEAAKRSEELKTLISLSKPPLAAQAPVPAAQVPIVAAAPHVKSGGHWLLRLATFRNESNAVHLSKRLKQQGFPVTLKASTRKGIVYYRVFVGPEKKTILNQWQKKLAVTEQLQGYIVKK